MHLLGQPLTIPPADVLGRFFDINFGKAQSSQALRAHSIGGLDRLADLIVDTCADQFDRMRQRATLAGRNLPFRRVMR